MVSTEPTSNRISPILKSALFVTAGYLVVWLMAVGDRVLLIERLPAVVNWFVYLLGFVLGAAWLVWVARSGRRSRVMACAVSSGVFIVCWQATLFVTDAVGWYAVRATLARWGTAGLFLLGLGWFIWWVERASQKIRQQYREKQYEQQRQAATAKPPQVGAHATQKPIWNPLDLNAWYYGRRAKKLNQSITAFTTYTLFFCLVFTILSQMSGCQEIYEMPAGGGEQKQIVQTIKVQKVIRKKFVVNPYSAILFEVPTIDETVNLNLNEVTKHHYEIGQGEGEGAGFAGGTFKGKVRFIRLEYSGGDWDQDFGIGGDLNLLTEYGIRTKHKIEKKTESRRIVQLKNFPVGKSPPVVYITGEKNISLSKNEIKILREYLIDKHGMIFADNGGSRHWENQFLSMMNRVLPDVRPVSIPLDDVIHRVPYPIPFLPFVAPHGARKEAMGWYMDGRWLCYYHPGDIGDAWADGHAGVKPEIWEACYQLGTNVLFYSHAEYSKWLEAQKKES